MNFNDHLSELFLTDARDFLNRYRTLQESATHSGLRSKLLVDLLFGLECSLKSLIFLESSDDAKITYKKIKKLSHSIEKLYENLSDESRQEFDKLVTIDLSIYNIFNRYMIESEIVFREEFGILGRTYYASIANPQWMDNVYKQIKSFIEYVAGKKSVDFKIQNISDIDIEAESLKYSMLKEIISK